MILRPLLDGPAGQFEGSRWIVEAITGRRIIVEFREMREVSTRAPRSSGTPGWFVDEHLGILDPALADLFRLEKLIVLDTSDKHVR